ncbi:hypothetical protein Pcinc_043974 [Petrolisthes cinctipes]|uniref:Uncharacterized protein n=1 Tax=Petrolisthes cinctipes TaxID=88211 RepID=A0AAE1BEM9_PETCI|nr:hypothetical protein Pcinc_043974 [Petrolisthes cinctipes]
MRVGSTLPTWKNGRVWPGYLAPCDTQTLRHAHGRTHLCFVGPRRNLLGLFCTIASSLPRPARLYFSLVSVLYYPSQICVQLVGCFAILSCIVLFVFLSHLCFTPVSLSHNYLVSTPILPYSILLILHLTPASYLLASPIPLPYHVPTPSTLFLPSPAVPNASPHPCLTPASQPERYPQGRAGATQQQTPVKFANQNLRDPEAGQAGCRISKSLMVHGNLFC